jgi:hypothetical protein
MMNKYLQKLGHFVILILVLAACSPSVDKPEVTETAVQARTAVPTSLPTTRPTDIPTSLPAPTATPNPTATSIPTSTPVPTATPWPTPDPSQLVALPGTAWNFELVGHEALGAIGWHAGLALKDHCAYLGSYARPEVAIVDVSDPARPVPLGTLDLAAGAQPVELRTLPDLNLLVIADLSPAAMLMTYDVTDCAQPVRRGTFTLPHAAHEFYLWRNEERVLAYAGTFSYGRPSLLAIDLTDPAQPVEVGRWMAANEGVTGLLHSLSVSPDGTMGYLAMWHGGLVVVEIALPEIKVVRDADGTFSAAQFPNTHSAVRLADPRYVLLASEVFDCPFEGLAIADLANPAHPRIVAHFTLPENRCNDLPRGGIFTPHNPLVVGSMAFVSWYGAGVQAVDLSDPLAPTRVGQFVPSGEGAAPRGPLSSYPVETFSYPIWRDGLIYVVDSQSGLYVLRYTGPGNDTLLDVPWAEGNVTWRP